MGLNMTLTIDLSPETEKKLLARSPETGKDIATLVREAVEEKLRTPVSTFAEILAPVHEDYRKSGMTEGELESLLQGTLDAARKERRQPQGNGS